MSRRRCAERSRRTTAGWSSNRPPGASPNPILSGALALAFVTLPAAIGAQSSKRPQPELSSTVVGSIRIERQNVFDRSDHQSWFARVANGLHMLTRERVVRRQMLIKTGKPFDSASAAETARNLRRLGIFRDVSVDTITTDSGLIARVVTRDSWTTEVYTSLKSGGNQTAWGLGIVERNFLGSQTSVTGRYIRDADRSTTQIGIGLPAVWRKRLGVIATVSHLSDGERSRLIVAAPFTSLSIRESLGFDVQYEDEACRGSSTVGPPRLARFVICSRRRRRPLAGRPMLPPPDSSGSGSRSACGGRISIRPRGRTRTAPCSATRN